MRILRYEIHGLRETAEGFEVVLNDDEANLFGVYGLVKGDVDEFYIPICDAPCRRSAESLKQLLNNKKAACHQQ